MYPTRIIPPPIDHSSDLPTYKGPALSAPNLPTRVVAEPQPGTVEYEEANLRRLQATPLKNLSRKKAAVTGFIRGLAIGLQGGPGAGAGGAITGAIAGAIAPGRTAEMQRDQQIAEQQAKLRGAIQTEGALSEIDTRRALSEQRRAKPLEDAEKAAQAARKDRIARLITMHGRLGRYNPNDPNDSASQAVKKEAESLGVANELVPYTKAEKVPPRQVVDGVTYERQDNGDWKAASGLPGRKMVDTPYGPVSPGTALTADATRENRDNQQRRTTLLDEKGRTENERKRQSYATEGQEWLEKEKTFRANKEAEDRAIVAKETKLAELYNEKPAGYFGGGRTTEQIKIDIARVQKDLEIHRANSTRFQADADKAAGSATEARRNAGIYTDPGGQKDLPTRSTTRTGKGGVRPKVSRQKLTDLLGVH
jgi:hypothetical protein